MCDICGSYPCLPGCPNNEPPEIYRCDRCGESIVAGDKFIEEPDGDIVCECCLDNMTMNDLLEELGISLQTAEVDIW